MEQKNSFSFFIFLLSFIIFLSSCSSPSGSNKVTYSGTVTLEDTTDYSGVTVALYAPVELDTALVRINEEYPNIGVQISQETEFDHREHEPLYTTETDADGNWEIKADEGEYNLVVEKEGWGWKYQFDNASTKNIETSLYKITELSGFIDENVTFEEDHFYYIKSDVIFAADRVFTFNKNAYILIGSNIKATFYGSIICPTETYFYITGYANAETHWNTIILNYENTQFRNAIIKNANNGITLKSNNISINNCYFNNNINLAIAVSSLSNINIQNALIANSAEAIDIFVSDNTNNIKKNIIYNSSDIGIALNASAPAIENNCFSYNGTAIFCIFASNPIIKTNQIEYSTKYGIELGGSHPQITYNNFNSNTERSIYIPPTGYAGSSNPVINYNNFMNSKYHVYMSGTQPNPNAYDIDATNNWWGTKNENQINSLIYDKYDIIDEDSYNSTGFVTYIPILNQSSDNAGIQF